MSRLASPSQETLLPIFHLLPTPPSPPPPPPNMRWTEWLLLCHHQEWFAAVGGKPLALFLKNGKNSLATKKGGKGNTSVLKIILHYGQVCVLVCLSVCPPHTETNLDAKEVALPCHPCCSLMSVSKQAWSITESSEHRGVMQSVVLT